MSFSFEAIVHIRAVDQLCIAVVVSIKRTRQIQWDMVNERIIDTNRLHFQDLTIVMNL